MKDYSVPNYSANSSAYKPFIKNITIEPVGLDKRKNSAEPNNKTFFSNIKAELNSIRTDVNKLVTKDAPRPSNTKGQYPSSSIVKPEILASMEATTDKFASKTTHAEGLDRYNSSSLAQENKISELNNKLAQQSYKSEEMQHQLDDEKRNQSFLRDQIATLKENQSRLEQELQNKNKETDNYKLLYQRILKEKDEICHRLEKL